jgi:Met-zincin/Domain of unknown function (DUF5117)
VHLARPAILLALAVVSGSAPAGAQRADSPGRPFTEVTRGSEVGTGLFTVYSQHEDVYLALTPRQLDHDYLLVTQISQGIGELGLDGGASLRSDLVRFHREGDKVELWVVNSHVAAAPDSPMARTVAYSFGHSVAQSFPIAAVRDSSQILINVGPFLLSDWADVGSVFQGAATQRKVSATITLDDKRSSLQELHLFPGNLEAEVRLTFQTTRDLGLETVSDYRWIPLGIHYSLLELPATPMRPRFADDRLGYFVSALKDFSRDTAESFFVRYVNRWRLEKKNPGAATSEPVQPITYYIDRTVPVEWRPYVRAGILEWNRAFEDAGFSDAIRVLDAPEDSSWSAADARYSTVRWTATNQSVYAVGPSNVDPRTGEILNADVLVSAAWIQRWRGQSGQYGATAGALESVFQEDSLRLAPGAESRLCRYGEGLSRDGELARTVLATRGAIPAGGEVSREYIGQALKALVMHEIGHTLGLRHNFRGSAGASAAQLASRAWTATHGFGVSVMDYLPPALALDPSLQGDYYAPTIGTYDRWAITYGYADVGSQIASAPPAKGAGGVTSDSWRPEVELNGLRAIASQAAEPEHLYASDEDAGFGGLGLDPTVSRYDMTDDPLGWARDRVTLIDGMFDSLETRVVAPGESYARLRSAFVSLLNDRWYALLVSTKYLGGAITSRDHRGDPGGREPVATIPAEQQRAALAFLTSAAFGEGAYRFRAELLKLLGPDRWSHWDASPASDGRIDFPLHDWAATQQGSLLGQLLDPAVLSRIRDAELRASASDPTVGLPELFATLTGTIWAEVGPGMRGKPAVRNITSVRRDLQRLYLNALVRMAVSPAPGTPEDARALARVTLSELGADLNRALANPKTELDSYTSAHLIDARQRIAQALNAGMIQTTTYSR